MLVLSRKQEEQIRIGDQIVVTVLRIKGNTVKIGIDAPRSVRVLRTELPLNAEAPEGAAEVAEATEAAEAVPVQVQVTRNAGRKSAQAPLSRFEAVIAQAIAK
jgi:carbon storage regulator CsrA